MGYIYYLITATILAITLFYINHIITSYNQVKLRSLYHVDKVLSLHTTENAILDLWYIKKSVTSLVTLFDIQELASQLLLKIYNISVDKNLLVMSDNLSDKLINVHQIYDLRSTIGINIEIAVVDDDDLRKKVIIKTLDDDIDIGFLNGVINNDLYSLTKTYVPKILESRWQKILSGGFDGYIPNDNKSFIYIKNDIDLEKLNIKSLPTKFGQRINLLCSDLDFNSLLERLVNIKKNITSLQ